MHSFTAKADDPTDDREFTIHHHGDYSGDCTIMRNVRDSADGPPDRALTVPCDVLFQFVGEYIRSQKIRAIEQASTTQLVRGEV